jgi:hypothetical protein
VNAYDDAVVMTGLRRAVTKMYHGTPDADDKIRQFFDEFQIYKDKQGEFSTNSLKDAAKNLNPADFYRTLLSFVPVLQFVGKRVLASVIGKNTSALEISPEAE